jgi:hypothetical protein
MVHRYQCYLVYFLEEAATEIHDKIKLMDLFPGTQPNPTSQARALKTFFKTSQITLNVLPRWTSFRHYLLHVAVQKQNKVNTLAA